MANNVGVRAYLNGLGVDNSRIGWNQEDKYVTLDGKYLMTPATVTDGKSYADANAIKNAYLQLQTNNVGGVVANPYQGKADGIIANVQNAAYAPTYTAPTYTPQYTGKVEGLLENVGNAQFSYDVETDPSWQVYREKYAREGDAAMNEAIAATAANTGGVLSSYGTAAANQARAAYAKKAADIIPTLEQQAWSRWDADQSRNMSLAQIYQNLEDANRANFESDRSFGRGVYESDRSQWNTEQNRQLDIASMYADLERDYYDRDYNERVLGYEQSRDAVADAQWEKEFALQQQAQAARSSGSSGSGSGTKSAGDDLPVDITPEQAYYFNYLYERLVSSGKVTARQAATTWGNYKNTAINLIGEELAGKLEEAIINRALGNDMSGVTADPDEAYYAALADFQTGKTSYDALVQDSAALRKAMGAQNYTKLLDAAAEAGAAQQEKATASELQMAINEAGSGVYPLEQVKKEAAALIARFDYDGYKQIRAAAEDWAEGGEGWS